MPLSNAWILHNQLQRTASEPADRPAPEIVDDRLDPNAVTTTAADLQKLPNIGEASAKRIIAARADGPFTDLDDMLTRAGITHINTEDEKNKLGDRLRF